MRHQNKNIYYLPLAARPGTGDYKVPNVHPCVCPSIRSPRFIKGFIYPVYEHKFTKLTLKVYTNNGMSFRTFSEKQDGRHSHFSIFFLLFSKPSSSGCVIVIVLNFSGEIDYYKRLLEKRVFGGCVHVCVCTGLAA